MLRPRTGSNTQTMQQQSQNGQWQQSSNGSSQLQNPSSQQQQPQEQQQSQQQQQQQPQSQPNAQQQQTCTSTTRREWRELSRQDQDSYIQAVTCLKQRPSRIQGIQSPSRYDDMVYAHSMVLTTAHGTPLFLPWHRMYIHIYEQVLQRECGMQISMPYWDWSLDAQDPASSALFSNDAFGGNGDPNNNMCLTSGPFANTMTTFQTAGECLSRDFFNTNGGISSAGALFAPEAVRLLVQTYHTFDQFRGAFEFGAHASIHNGVGGTMRAIVQSANGTPILSRTPLFPAPCKCRSDMERLAGFEPK